MRTVNAGNRSLKAGREGVHHQIQPPGGTAQADAALVLQRRDAGLGRVLNLHHGLGRLDVDLSGTGGHQPVLLPDEQGRIQLALQLQKVLAQRGLGDEQLLGGPGHALLSGDLQNIFRVFDIHRFPP